ncbi:apolipoprotein A-IV-like [Littorina saxatilis]|uniref:apolipoprotein A-IV-like n=1 Tax=Littorina saxatilis TaxID=31220 RepID=UPI0038B4F809
MAAASRAADLVAPLNTFQQGVQTEVTSGKSKEDIKARLKAKFGKMKQDVNKKIDNLETEVMSHADDTDFETYATKMEPVIDEVKVTFDDVFLKLKGFLESLWDWLKQKIIDIATRVQQFFVDVKDKVLSMAKNMDYAQQTRTTTVPAAKEMSLVLRHKAETLKKDIRENLPTDKLINDAKGSTEKDAKDAMSATLAQFRAHANSNIDNMQEEIMSHAPDEPTRQEGQTEEEFQNLQEQYEKDLALFEVYAEEATQVVESVVEILTNTITRLQEFSQYAWKLIKEKDPKIDKKCKEFMAKLVKDIQGGFTADPGSSVGENKMSSGRPSLSGRK